MGDPFMFLDREAALDCVPGKLVAVRSNDRAGIYSIESV